MKVTKGNVRDIWFWHSSWLLVCPVFLVVATSFLAKFSEFKCMQTFAKKATGISTVPESPKHLVSTLQIF